MHKRIGPAIGGRLQLCVSLLRRLLTIAQAVHPNVTTIIANGEWHDRPTIAAWGGGGEQDTAIKSFIKARL